MDASSLLIKVFNCKHKVVGLKPHQGTEVLGKGSFAMPLGSAQWLLRAKAHNKFCVYTINKGSQAQTIIKSI